MRNGVLWAAAMLPWTLALGGCPGDDDADRASDEGGGSHDVDAGGVIGGRSGQSGGAGRTGGSGGSGQNGGAGGRIAGNGGAQGEAGQAGASTGSDGGVTTGGTGDGGSGQLRWYETCGHPVCGLTPDPHDDPNVPNCTSERAGDACDEADAQCDAVADCGAMLRCTGSDPTMQAGGCPRSRARFKRDIDYVSEQERRAYHEQLVSLPLASWQYRDARAAAPQLGFIIEDVEPSAAVSGDRVNMYGYLSMAVAAIQVQQAQIDALEHELRAVRDQLAGLHDAPLCAP